MPQKERKKKTEMRLERGAAIQGDGLERKKEKAILWCGSMGALVKKPNGPFLLGLFGFFY